MSFKGRLRIYVMKKIDFTQYARIIANVGVIAGIVFLGFEFRQNNELLDLQIRSTNLEQRQEIIRSLFENPDVIALLHKEQATLNDMELDRLRLLGVHALIGMENNYHEANLGLGDIDDLARRFRALVHRERLHYGILLGWQIYQKTADPGFVNWFDANVVESENR